MESLGEQLIEGFDDAGVLSYCLRNACSEIGNSSKEHHELRRAFREFTARCITPRRREQAVSGGLPRELWLKMGAAGFLCPWLQSEYGGPALSFAFRAAAAEPIRLGAPTTLSIFQGDEMLKSATMAVWQILGTEAFPTGAADFSTGLLLAKASFRVIIENRIHYILW